MKINNMTVLSGLVMAATLLVIVQSCTESQGKGSAIPGISEPIPVKIMSLKRSETAAEVFTSGKLTTDDETILSFKTGGVLNAVFVDDGDKVRKGQLLATLDLTEINSFVAQAKSGLEKAERDFLRARNLYKDSVATLEQLQNAETSLELAKEQYNAASFNRSYSQIRALSDGYVLKRFLNAGQVVGIGDPVIQTNGAGDGKWILRTGVSDRQWSSIKLNDKALISLDASPAKQFTGVVTRRSETADPGTGSFTVEVTIREKGTFASGMMATAKIISSDKTQSWSIPYEAVLDANGNEGFVFVTADERKAMKKPVIIESFDGAGVRISAGLEDAESVIVSGSAYLTDNSPIRVMR